jgi:ABC-type cobalt transport system substrate-binding protein
MGSMTRSLVWLILIVVVLVLAYFVIQAVGIFGGIASAAEKTLSP